MKFLTSMLFIMLWINEGSTALTAYSREQRYYEKNQIGKRQINCSAPAIPVKCSETCPESCEGKSTFCKRECPSIYVCECPKGFVLLTRNGKECVKKRNCPSKCPPPQRNVTCGSLCQPTCNNLKPASCRRGCSSRTCICPRDMVQPNEDNYTCIFPSDCPQESKEPRIHKGCPSKCQPTCQDPTPGQDNCALGCRNDKFVCPPGFIHLSSKDKTCVRISKCPKQCTFPEMRVHSRSSCVARCDNLNTLNDLDCPAKRGEGVCICADGYVQRSKSNRTCVKLSACPPVPTKPPVQCKAPKLYAECASKCPPTCLVPKPLACTRGCDPTVQCACPSDYVQRDEENTTCIKLEDCPVECKAPKIYAECASQCPPTCLNPKPLACTRGCDPTAQCICPSDYVQRDKKNTTCIKLKDCPEECTHPKTHKVCPSRCQPTCRDPTPDQDNCDLGCRKDKCVCPPGLVLLNSKDKTCVKISKCSKQCTFPEVPVYSRSSCVARCDNLNTLDDLDCPAKRGEYVCVCANGYVQRSKSNRTCVKLSACPPVPTKLPAQCEAPRVYAECASECPPTCLLPKPLACTRGCDPTVECVCPSDYVQRDKKNTTCIKLKDCPERKGPQTRCPRPRNISFGNVQQTTDGTYQKKAVLTYSCQAGYELMGTRRRTCQPNGQWSGSKSRCKQSRSRCETPRDLQDGRLRVRDTQYRDNSSVRYICNDGYILRGDSQRVCQNGIWSGRHPQCVRQ